MSTSSLAFIKKKYGINDKSQINYEKTENELILHIQLEAQNEQNQEIIQKANELAQNRQVEGWSRREFFADFMKVRNNVLNDVRAHYGKK